MASPFQQQARNRKMLYIGCILVLFTAAWGWRRYVIDDLANKLAIREESRGEVELVGSIMRLSLMGVRGVVTCVLWNQAFEKQKLNQWNEVDVLVRALTKLQPHFITPWLFQSWNLAYNVSVEADRPRDKYFYVTRGVELLAQGERQNKNHPDLRWNIGNYISHKIGRSDETNYMRSLMQLSMIPPNERDPARFWKRVESKGSDGKTVTTPTFNYAEFARFATEHPQLVRRLREGMGRESDFARINQFTCATPQDVVQYLEDNARVPSIYQLPDHKAAGQDRVWDPTVVDKPLAELERFPVLPPATNDLIRQDKKPFDREALTSASTLHDWDDPFTVAHAWWSYAQEPLPEPGPMPGSSQEIEDRARQRRPRHMTTLIFRNYPAQGLRSAAERLQEEGWFDEEGWEIKEWFNKAPELAGRTISVGGGTKWSQDAWARSYRAWKEHGDQNHLTLLAPAEEQNLEDDAAYYTRRHGPVTTADPVTARTDLLSERERRGLKAARWISERNFYSRVSNFAHFLTRTRVEMQPVTVASRKMFDRARRIKYAGQRSDRALRVYQTVITAGMAKADPTVAPLTGHSPLTAWRDLVLKPNDDFRHDNFIQEQSAEIQLAYMRLLNDVVGRNVKARLAEAAPFVPLLPPLSHDLARWPIFAGPFENLRDKGGMAYVPDSAMETALERMHLPSRRKKKPASMPDKQPARSAPGGS